MISLTGLRRRGWTPFMVRQLLGSPDQEVPITSYKKVAPKGLWTLARVEAMEATPEFAQLQAMARRRAQAGRQGVQTRTNQLLAQIAVMEVTVKAVPSDQLLSNAITAFNSWPKRTPATKASDQHLLARIAVNYIRHSLADYNTELEFTATHVSFELRAAIWRKVFTAIAATYPQYAEECERQLTAKLSQS